MYVQRGSTSKSLVLYLQDAASGGPYVTEDQANFTFSYIREGAVAAVADATITAGTLGTWADGTAKPFGTTGYWQIDFADAAFAAGADYVELLVTHDNGAFLDVPVHVDLDGAHEAIVDAKLLFESGIVYVDSDGTNSTAYPYGSAQYPTTTIANGKTIADALGLETISIRGTQTLAAAMEHYAFIGRGHIDVGDIVDLNGQSTQDTSFSRLVVTGAGGNAAGIGDQTAYFECFIYEHTDIQGWVKDCRVEGACSVRDGGYAVFQDCVFGSSLACTLTLQAPTVCDIENLSGTLTVSGMDGGSCSISLARGAILTIDNTCTAGTITLTGDTTHVTDNSDGTTVNITVTAANVTQWLGTACGTPYTDGVPRVDVTSDGHTWYVADGGDDAADGLSWGTALATIAQAITNSSSGDTIEVGPGTFAQEGTRLDPDTATTIRGRGWGLTSITGTMASNGVIKMVDDLHLEDLTVSNSAAGFGLYAIPTAAAARVYVKGCRIYGGADSVAITTGVTTVTSAVFEDCVIDGPTDGITTVLSAADLVFRRCLISLAARALYITNGSEYEVKVLCENCLVRSTEMDPTSGVVEGHSSQTELHMANCLITGYGDQSGGTLYGVRANAGAIITLSGCAVRVRGGGSNHDLHNDSSTIRVANTLYSTTSGTITRTETGTDVAAILTDTAEIGEAGAGLTEAGGTGNHLSAVPWNSAWAAYVNAQVKDVLETDTHAEPGQGVPPATASLAAKIGYVYKAWRNKSTQAEEKYRLFADDGETVDHEAEAADDGTTFTRGEMGSGA